MGCSCMGTRNGHSPAPIMDISSHSTHSLCETNVVVQEGGHDVSSATSDFCLGSAVQRGTRE